MGRRSKGLQIPSDYLGCQGGHRWETGATRNGYFVDLAPGPRQGQPFLIQHDGKTFHAYGSPADRHEVAVGGHQKNAGAKT